MAPEAITTLFRIRLVATFNSGNKEITNDLPHLHQCHYEVVAFQPGNPGSSALGSFSVQLHPPGSEGYAAAKAIYDQIDYIQRVELYGSPDGQSLGKLYYAGVITGIRKGYGQNPVFELSGVSDLFWLNYSRPFPGEELSTNYGSGLTTQADYRQAHNYFGTNELALGDNFSPFTAGNYTSTNLPSLTAGSWSSTTDDGLNVVSTTTGTGAVLISKTGAVGNDKRRIIFVEASGRLAPSSDATNGGKFGVGMSQSNANANNAAVAYVTARSSSTLDVTLSYYQSGTLLTSQTVSSAFTGAQDPEGFVPITISLSISGGPANTFGTSGTAVTVNGKVVLNINTSPQVLIDYDATAGTNYPFLFYGTAATGTAAPYFAYLVEQNRYTDDQNANTAMFKAGTIGSPLFSLQNSNDPGPTFLELISRVASRETWYWRYTPQAYVIGTRTVGTLDLTADPGTDHGTDKSVVFSVTDGTLVNLEFSANADQLMAGTVSASLSGSDGGGVAFWRDVSTMTKYGVIDDQVLGLTRPYFYEQRRHALQTVTRKVAINASGSKTAVVLREPKTADVWRELDKVMLHVPEIGVNYLVARVIGYTFDEGQATQTLTLDQFGIDNDITVIRALQQGIFQTTLKFGNR